MPFTTDLIMHQLLLLLTVISYSSACTSDRQCSAFHKCTMQGTCIEVPKLGRNCSTSRECKQIDSWADCIQQTCQCTGDTVDHGYECVNLIPRFGKSRDAKIIFYVLLAVTSSLAVGLAIAELVERRVGSSCVVNGETGIEEDPPLFPPAGSSNSLNSSLDHSVHE